MTTVTHVESGSISKILVVDDDRFVRESIVDSLDLHHLAATPAASLREARERLVTGTFDAVVLDWMMPDRAGPILLEQLAKTAPHIRRIVFSAHDTIDGEATARGAEAFVSKSAPADALRLAIERLLRTPRIDRPAPSPPLPASLAAAARRLAKWVDRPAISLVVSGGRLADEFALAMVEHFAAGAESVIVQSSTAKTEDDWRAALFGRVDVSREVRIDQGL